MDSTSKLILLLLLGGQVITIALGEVTTSADGSVSMTEGGAKLELVAGQSLTITDPTGTAYLLKYFNSVYIRQGNRFLQEDSEKLEVGDEQTRMTKYSDGSVVAQIERLSLVKNYFGTIRVSNGDSMQLQKNQDGSTYMGDGQLILERKPGGTVSLIDGGSAHITKTPNQFTNISAGYALLQNGSDKSVALFDGVAVHLRKYADKSVSLQDANTYLTKTIQSMHSMGDGESALSTNKDGSSDIYANKCHLRMGSDGALIIKDYASSMSIVKEATDDTMTTTVDSEMVKYENGIEVTLYLTQQESENLEVQIISHVLRAEVKKGQPMVFETKLPGRIKEEDVQMCFLNDGAVVMAIDRKKKSSIPCPGGTIRSLSLKSFQEK